jgi:hypothetical protein
MLCNMNGPGSSGREQNANSSAWREQAFIIIEDE